MKYKSQVVYNGYVDDFVTSINGYLEVTLNFATQSKLRIRVKKLGSIFLWVPFSLSNLDLIRKYETIILSYSDMVELWTKLGYSLEDDLRLISEVTSEDLKLLWVINSHVKFFSNDILETVKYLDNNIIAYSHENSDFLKKNFNNLIKNDWNNLRFGSLKQLYSEQDKLVVYLDDGTKTVEWSALLEDDRKNIYINIGNQWCLPLDSYFKL